MPAEIHLTAYKRVPFIELDGCTIAKLGPSMVGEAFLMQIRNAVGDTGTPIISIVGAAAGLQGISATYDAAFIYNDAGATTGATKVLVQIDEATLEALSLNNPANMPVNLFYDMHVGTGLAKRVEFYGKFTINPGVSI